MPRQITGYQIIDSRTGLPVSKTYAADKGRAARRRADKLDMAYGAIRYIVRIVWADTSHA